MDTDEEASRVYAIRVSESARDDLQDSLFAVLRQLATFPGKHVIAPENRFFTDEMRQLVYRRRPASPAYRVLFTILDDPEEGPSINVIHVRHGSRRPMTRTEARERQRAIHEERGGEA